jgi:ribosome biogenesis GTPase
MKALVTKSTGSWYHVRNEQGEKLQVRLRGKLKLVDKKITNPVTVGDEVILEQVEGDFVITDIVPRSNYVVRASPRKKGHAHLIAANVDQAMLIASLRQPKTSLGFIDRFLITLETFRIPGIIVWNKADIYNSDEKAYLRELNDLYASLGYQTMLVSIQEDGVTQIKKHLEGKTTLLSGHSGTGKSTMINGLFPEVRQDVQEVSDFADKGVHTTTFGEMFIEDGHYKVIDTPGIKELGLAEIEPEELSHYFPEMRQLFGSCKYHNCQHVNEPGCAVKEAVMEGTIAESRFDSYLSMLFGEDNRR